MQIMICNKNDWSESVNFVDENDVFVGYDLTQDCCEHADWYLSKVPTFAYDKRERFEVEPEGLESYVFDVGDVGSPFFGEDYEALECGMYVRLKLVSEGKNDLYLFLFNCHNGFYSHGFEIKVEGETLTEGSL